MFDVVEKNHNITCVEIYAYLEQHQQPPLKHVDPQDQSLPRNASTAAEDEKDPNALLMQELMDDKEENYGTRVQWYDVYGSITSSDWDNLNLLPSHECILRVIKVFT